MYFINFYRKDIKIHNLRYLFIVVIYLFQSNLFFFLENFAINCQKTLECIKLMAKLILYPFNLKFLK